MMEDLNDLRAFVVVAREQSFTRAAAKLGVSRSALSHSMRTLEERIGLRLLSRTTRSVSTTEAGGRLFLALADRLEEIDSELASLMAWREKPAGTVRMVANDHAIKTVMWPRLMPVLRHYPDIQIELIVDYGLTDIVAQRFDAGVRPGSQLAKDMIGVRIGADIKMAVVGSPAYFDAHPTPEKPHDLEHHSCINLYLPTYGGLYAWEFERDGQAVSVRLKGQAVFSNTFLMLDAAIDGIGLAYVPRDAAQPSIDAGMLVSVLEDWCPTFPGYHLYYASRRQLSPAMSVVIDALRYSSP